MVLRAGMGGIMSWYGWYYEMVWVVLWMVWMVLRDGMGGIKR